MWSLRLFFGTGGRSTAAQEIKHITNLCRQRTLYVSLSIFFHFTLFKIWHFDQNLKAEKGTRGEKLWELKEKIIMAPYSCLDAVQIRSARRHQVSLWTVWLCGQTSGRPAKAHENHPSDGDVAVQPVPLHGPDHQGHGEALQRGPRPGLSQGANQLLKILRGLTLNLDLSMLLLISLLWKYLTKRFHCSLNHYT